jgi:hypothetical protein
LIQLGGKDLTKLVEVLFKFVGLDIVGDVFDKNVGFWIQIFDIFLEGHSNAIL